MILPTDDLLCVTSNVDAPILAAAEHASDPACPPPTTMTSYVCCPRCPNDGGRLAVKRPKNFNDITMEGTGYILKKKKPKVKAQI